MNTEQRQHLERLLRIHQRRLRALEEQEARAGAGAQPDILIEIEDIQTRITDIENQLAGKQVPQSIQREPSLTSIPIIPRWIYLAFGVLVVIAVLAGWYAYRIGVNKGQQVEQQSPLNTLSIDALPFVASDWADSTLPNERGWSNFSLVNDDQPNKAYRLEYTLPTTNTKYSGAGLAFSFSKSQDLDAYKFIEINITFDSPNARCNLDMRDIAKNINSVQIGINVPFNQDIVVKRNGNTQTITIPFGTYFNSINRKAILDMGCSVSTDFAGGNHNFIINQIKFSK